MRGLAGGTDEVSIAVGPGERVDEAEYMPRRGPVLSNYCLFFASVRILFLRPRCNRLGLTPLDTNGNALDARPLVAFCGRDAEGNVKASRSERQQHLQIAIVRSPGARADAMLRGILRTDFLSMQRSAR
jgi:hypothetical protein